MQAYFMGNDYLGLPTVETDPILSQLTIPPNVYTTVQNLLRKSERRASTLDGARGSTLAGFFSSYAHQ
jgi:hypothetical protein